MHVEKKMFCEEEDTVDLFLRLSLSDIRCLLKDFGKWGITYDSKFSVLFLYNFIL